MKILRLLFAASLLGFLTASAQVQRATADQQLTGKITFSGTITPTQITANQNDYSPTGFATATVLRLSTDASRNVTGLAAGSDGRFLALRNVGSFNLVLVNQSSSSTAANRFAFTADYTLRPDGAIGLLYDGTSARWRLLYDLPGTAVTPGSYGSATQSGTFTVDQAGRLTAAASVTVTPAVGSITGLATGVGTFLATPTSANLALAITDEVGTGSLYFTNGALGTPSSGNGSNLTALNAGQLTSGTVPIARLYTTAVGYNITGGAALDALAGGSAFTQFTGPTTSIKVFTLPNASATILTDNALVTGAQGGTGVNNSGKTITLGGNLATSGAFAITFTATGTTGVTLPTTGTLATLAGTETLTGKSIADSQLTGAYTASGQTLATARLLGRTTASSGAAEEISAGTGLTLSSGTLDRAAISGDVSVSAGSNTAVVNNLPTGATVAGSLLATNIAAPSTPAAGKNSLYFDSTSKNMASKNDAGTVNHGVQTQATASNTFVTGISDAGAVSIGTSGVLTLDFTYSAAPSGATGGSGTWSYDLPSGAKYVEFQLVTGGGGGGGAGGRFVSGTNGRGGGAGGASVRHASLARFPVADLGSTTLAVVVGIGGAGASGQTTNDTAGATGTAGGDTTITINSVVWYKAVGGNAGVGGGNAAGGTGGAAVSYGIGAMQGVFAVGAGAAGGAAGGTTGAGTAGTASNIISNTAAVGTYAIQVPSAGGGGALPTTPSNQSGGAGGAITNGNSVVFAAGGTASSGAAGGTGGTMLNSILAGAAGGGSSNAAGTGFAGGDATGYGMGGGGGGASLNGSVSGAGGSGKTGFVRIVVYF